MKVHSLPIFLLNKPYIRLTFSVLKQNSQREGNLQFHKNTNRTFQKASVFSYRGVSFPGKFPNYQCLIPIISLQNLECKWNLFIVPFTICERFINSYSCCVNQGL